ncbi:SRPBCC family protein [Nocardia halotolerans]|uniref:SRPBCC family protein n=1 Tax=Nocardia halotolerans TaxID=1755878 RepID=A0ABV8VLS6_9NOCA
MHTATDIFDPALYAATRLPREQAETLPYPVYTDQAWFEREMETVFRPAWHFAGLASSIPDSGDFRTLRLLDEPLLIVRGDDQQVRGVPQLLPSPRLALPLPLLDLQSGRGVMWWIHKIPDSPTRTRVRVGYCFPASTIERPDFDEVSERYFQRLDQVIEEDDWITEHQQQGLHRSAPGSYLPEEHVVHRLDNWILDQVLGA